MCRKQLQTYIICVIIVFVIIYIILFSMAKTNAIIYWTELDERIRCYSEEANDALQSVEDFKFSSKSKSIFFLITSCHAGIDSHQACAVESAALAHPDWQVYLLFSAPVTQAMFESSCLVKLLQYSNMNIARIHALSFSNHTKVNQIISRRLKNRWKAGQFSTSMLKMLILNKWGGVIIDLDVLVLKPFIDTLPSNWIAKEYSDVFSGVLRISKSGVGHYFTEDVLQEISWKFNTENPLFDGELAIDQAMVKRCGSGVYSSKECEGIFILDPALFYKYTSKKEPLSLEEYTFYKRKHTNHPSSIYVRIAEKVCPKIYEKFGDQFGIK